jgi:hypothetical protein
LTIIFITLTGFVSLQWWINHKRGQFQRANLQIQQLGVAIQTVTDLSGNIPGPTYKDAIIAILQYPDLHKRFLEPYYADILTGTDPWGMPMIYIISSDHCSAIIRSSGSNRKDEGGSGDDIEYRIDNDRKIK